MYTIFKIPKRRGGFRTIEQPDDDLMNEQREILRDYLQEELRVSPFAHAFQAYKNIVTMAMGHVKKKWVSCIDIEDFFPSITRPKFRYQQLDNEKLNKCFHDFNDKKGSRLPQGSPTSPFLSNVYLHDFDWRMAWLSHRFKCDYSRYADDIVFSGNSIRSNQKLIIIATKMLKQYYALKVHPQKTKHMHKNRRQMVCGIIVNEKLNLPRKLRKNLRAEIFQQNGKLSRETKGRISFHEMVRESKKTTMSSIKLLETLKMIKQLKN